jgi:branched-chain amino acid transport system permease protein
MSLVTLSLLNGLSYGLLLFMLSAGLTLIWGMLGVLNFAHAAFYMLGAYVAYSVSAWLGFWPALLLAPLAVGLAGALFERFALRRVRRFGHVTELLMTFGLSYILVEFVQLLWGRSSVDYRVPHALDGPLFSLFDLGFAAYRVFMMVVAIGVFALLGLLSRTRTGLVMRAALTQPSMTEALGHNVPRILTLVFAVGCALAGLAGVLGGAALVTEPGMAQSVGGIVFVIVVVGGLGSLRGALAASLLIGLLQTFAVAWNMSAAPALPYLVMVLTLVWRPQGLLGMRPTHEVY